ncbi:UNVERIFIED_ORG: 3-oxoacyl-[acyl-carrier protein] reductase [Gordonia westfalica J30]
MDTARGKRGAGMRDGLAGRTAIVTGASRGIGLGIAKRLIAEGAQVVVTGRDASMLDDAVACLGGADVALAVPGRAHDPAHQADTVRQAIETFGSLDFLVNNVGINPWYGPVIELDADVARKVVDVNCLAPLGWMQQAHRSWMGEHGGAVVNIASHSALRPAPGVGIYGASKAMLIALTEVLAAELAPDIRVNAVAPAVVKTRFSRALYEEREATIADAYPLKRLGAPSDIGAAVAFLLSDDASWVTGELLVVDGGVTLVGEELVG